ncbi:Transposable element Tc1 transposase [Portunus trituberculatus]|uniref:Transposable element Tc1 transposase n=1 Tax=Portunus trituberculatus TaxID=210409 RepID=A0A5B7KM70_PORTR|nr:Transposable element Tc1 transposase [Portunus trituberculatus]
MAILKREVITNPLRRHLHDDLDFRSHRPVKKPLLTPTQQARRVAFAKKYSEWDVARWQHVLWSDEFIFRVTDNARGNVYRRPGSDQLDPKFSYSTVKHP